MGSWRVRVSLAQAYGELGMPAKAIKGLVRAKDLNPDSP